MGYQPQPGTSAAREVLAANGLPATYRARVYESTYGFWRKRPCWRFDIERYWTHWAIRETSYPFMSEADAEAAAHARLDEISSPPRGRYVSTGGEDAER